MIANLPSTPSPPARDAQATFSRLPEPSRMRKLVPARHWSARFGRCEVRPASREVLIDGRNRPLQPRAFDLLVYLIEQRDRVVTINELLDEIWLGRCVQPGSLAAAVLRVRKALEEPEIGFGTIIRTHQRIGYRFVAVLEPTTAQP